MISTRLRVPSGTALQLSAGETSSPSQVYRAGMVRPGSKAVLVISMAQAPSCGVATIKQKNAPTRSRAPGRGVRSMTNLGVPETV